MINLPLKSIIPVLVMRRTPHDIFNFFLKHSQNHAIVAVILNCVIAGLSLFYPLFDYAQPSADSTVLDVARLSTSMSIDRSVFFGSFKKNSVTDDQIPELEISQLLPPAFKHKIPYTIIGKTLVLKFYLYNGADSIKQFYFTPGRYCEKIAVYKSSPWEIKKNFSSLPYQGTLPEDQQGYERLSLGPKEKAIFFASINIVRTGSDYLDPKIIAPDFLPYFKPGGPENNDFVILLNYVIAGVLLMMIFYSISVYLQNYSIEFLYYSVYAGCMATWLFLKSYLLESNSPFNYFFEGYLDFIIQITGYSFYLLFFRRFLDTRKNHPFLEKMLLIGNWTILILLILFGISYFLTDGFGLINFIETTTKLFLLVASVVFIVYGIIKKEPLMNYLVAGQCMLTFFSIICFLLIATSFRIIGSSQNILNDPLFYYQIGLILELILLMAGLSYKNKKDWIDRLKEQGRLKLDNERKEFEKQVAVLEAKQQERNRISADMHDELGSGVTAIRLMSEIVKTKMKENTLPEIEKISNSANELLNKMNTIIWTMVSSNDTLESLIAYIRAYAVEFFESTPINCHFNSPSSIPAKALSGEKRRNIFLAFKEALNNVLKHSQAANVTIYIMVENKLIITIADDGIGINMEKLRKFGNGLHNMKKRVESIEGEFLIENNQGTRTVFELNL
jgi:signal transduction histidine kinase